jgi:hypothetical protein
VEVLDGRSVGVFELVVKEPEAEQERHKEQTP